MEEVLFLCKLNQEDHINNANNLKTSHNSKWLLLGNSGWLAMAHMKMKTHLWFENSFVVTNYFIVTNGTEPYSVPRSTSVEPGDPVTSAQVETSSIERERGSSIINVTDDNNNVKISHAPNWAPRSPLASYC